MCALNQCEEQFPQANMQQSAVNAGMQAKAAAEAQEERLKRIEQQSAATESKLAAAEARAAQAEARLQVPATQSLVIGLNVRSQNNFSAPQEIAIAASWTSKSGDHQASWGALHLQSLHSVMSGCCVSICDRTCCDTSTHNLPALHAGFRAGADGAVPQEPIWQRRGGIAAPLLPRGWRSGRGVGTPQPVGAAGGGVALGIGAPVG